jgi:hypothetical protein
MESFLLRDEDEDKSASRLIRQAVSFLVQAGLALASWLALMLVGYALNPSNVSQGLILVLSLAIPLIVGFAINSVRRDEMASAVWLLGLIWLMIVALYIVDMPTRPNQCFQCGVSEKLTRTLFSIPSPSGLMDDDGPFLGTWPCAALVGYSIGAALALRHHRATS